MPKNRQYKDTVFKLVLNDREELLALYNAIANTSLGPETELKIVTLDDVIWQDKVNDVAFTINNELIVLLEHQSTMNPNMPVRFLLYLAREYERLMPPGAKYATKAVQLPRPRFIMFYNGNHRMDDHVQMRLTDLMPNGEHLPESGVELTVDAYNINYGHNRELMEQCRALQFYSILIHRVETEQQTEKNLEIAVKRAVKWCKEQEILPAVLLEREGELVNMLLSEWDWDEAKQVWQDEAYEDGVADGKAKIILNIMESMNLSLEDALKIGKIPEEEWNRYQKLLAEMTTSQAVN